MLKDCPNHLAPKVWLRFVDDTFTTLHDYAIEAFTTYLNSRNKHIQFTREVEENDQIPFLDVCVHLQDDGSLKTTVYRKPTHTDQYLNWESNHPLDHKRSVVRTLLNRVETHVSDPKDRDTEISHIREVLAENGYKKWALKVPNQKDRQERSRHKQASTPPGPPPPLVGLPYVKGLSEELQRLFKKHGVNVYFKPTNTLRQLLVKPKDKTETSDKCGVVYNIACDECQDFYIGETARKMGKRFQEHTKSDKESALLEHLKKTGHSISLDNVSILANEPRYHARKIREAIKIHQRRPTLNRDQGLELDPVLLQLLPSPDDPPTSTGPWRVGIRNRANSL